MRVKVMNRLYRMNRKEFESLLKIASENVPKGIYAVEKNGYAELKNDVCDSITQLKKERHELRRQGFKVYLNGM